MTFYNVKLVIEVIFVLEIKDAFKVKQRDLFVSRQCRILASEVSENQFIFLIRF